MTRILLKLSAFVLACGCSGSEGPRPTTETEAAGGSATTPMAVAGNAAASAAGSAAAATAGGTGTAGMPAASAFDAPAAEAPLVAFLNAKEYSGWAKEANYHASSGPHGDGVRVYYSPRAAVALRSGATTFPAGAAAVKELTSGGSIYGWAVWVKVQDATDGGNGFFWYELIHQGGGMDSIYGNALGSGDCVGCHQPGKDYDLSTLPFE